MDSSSGILKIHDTRTLKDYSVPIKDNVIRTADLRQIVVEKARRLQILDPGFQNTAAVRSQITLNDHDDKDSPARFTLRGLEIDWLRRTHDFETVAHLLLWGATPDQEEKQDFRNKLAQASRDIPMSAIHAIQAFPREAPYLPMIVAGLSTYLAAHEETIPALRGQDLYHGDVEALNNGCIRTIAVYYAILAAAYCHKTGKYFELKVDSNEDMIINLLRMMGLIQDPNSQRTKTLIRVFNEFWVVSADHGMCNSTAAMLHAASTMNDPISCFICAITSSYGILHLGGQANAYQMLQRIGKPENVTKTLKSKLSKGERIPGVGHCVYKSEDPRAIIMKELLDDMRSKGMTDPLYDVALEIERQVGQHQDLRKRRLCVNPDLYLSLIYTSLGIDAEVAMSIFLASRVVGMMAHWRESMLQPIKLWRPRAIYTSQEQPAESASTRRASKL